MVGQAARKTRQNYGQTAQSGTQSPGTSPGDDGSARPALAILALRGGFSIPGMVLASQYAQHVAMRAIRPGLAR